MFFNKLVASTLASYIILAGVATAFNGDAKFYYPSGPGKCGNSQTGDYVVALSPQQYNGGSHCGQIISVTYQGKTISATVVDICDSCAGTGINLSAGAFGALSSLDAGKIGVTWNY